jgi:hypothetical protein
MAVRNFYIDCDIDGRETRLAGGPRAKDGEMTIHLSQREAGEIVEDVVKITCREFQGVLTTTVYDNDGNKVYEYRCIR